MRFSAHTMGSEPLHAVIITDISAEYQQGLRMMGRFPENCSEQTLQGDVCGILRLSNREAVVILTNMDSSALLTGDGFFVHINNH